MYKNIKTSTSKKELRKSLILIIRMSKEEKNLLIKNAVTSGLTVSDYVRDRIAGKAITPLAMKTAFFNQIESRLIFVGNMGNNLNQLTQSLHMIRKGLLLPSSEFKDLEELLVRTSEMLEMVLQDIKQLRETIC